MGYPETVWPGFKKKKKKLDQFNAFLRLTQRKKVFQLVAKKEFERMP